MGKMIETEAVKTTEDAVIEEVRRAKDTLSAQYGHDLDKLFAATRDRERHSGHPLVECPPKRRKA